MSDLEKVENFCSYVKKIKDVNLLESKSNNIIIDNAYFLYPSLLKKLQGISLETRELLTEVLKNYQLNSITSSSNSGYVESELIKRFLNPTFFLHKKLKDVSGPTSIHQMSHPKHPQIYYVLSDMHIRTDGCGNMKYHIGNWLEDTIKNSPVFIDVYVEKAYVYKKYPSIGGRFDRVAKVIKPTDDYIDIVRSFFSECFRHQKYETVCKTSRFHYTDMRDIFETETQFEGGHSFLNEYIFKYIEKIELENMSVIKRDEIVRKLNNYFEFLRNRNSIVYRRIDKQFKNIKDEKLRNKLRLLFEKDLNYYSNSIRHISPDINGDYQNIESHRMDGILRYVSELMDYYLIARSLRSFKKIKDVYSRPSYNNIIYTGGWHVNNYVNILLNLGFKTEFESYSDRGGNLQCLDISDMEQPMFHQRYKK
jgi:hypothetical protein